MHCKCLHAHTAHTCTHVPISVKHVQAFSLTWRFRNVDAYRARAESKLHKLWIDMGYVLEGGELGLAVDVIALILVLFGIYQKSTTVNEC